jgi:MFS family permease
MTLVLISSKLALLSGFTFCRVLCGTGAVLLNVLLTKMLIDWFSGREVIAAMAILVNSWPFGIALGLITQGWIAENYSWSVVQYIAAGMSLVGLLLMVALYRKPPTKAVNSKAGAKPRGLPAWEFSLASVAGLIWCLYNVSLIIVISFAPNVLHLNGMAITEAAILVSVGTWIGIATLPIGGYIAQRYQASNSVMIASFLATTCAILWIPDAALPLIPFIVFGVLAWASAGPIMALPAEVLHVDSRGPSMGIFFS